MIYDLAEDWREDGPTACINDDVWRAPLVTANWPRGATWTHTQAVSGSIKLASGTCCLSFHRKLSHLLTVGLLGKCS